MTIQLFEDLALDVHSFRQILLHPVGVRDRRLEVRRILDACERRAGIGDQTVLLLLVEARRDERTGVRELLRIAVGQANRPPCPPKSPRRL